MSEFSRRDLLRTVALAATTGAVDAQDGQHVHEIAAEDRKANAGAYQPKALTSHEYATLERLTDLIIPPEGNSPGAVAAGAAAWIDMLANENAQLAAIYTGGLAWLDRTMERRAVKDFVSASPAEQTALLDLIAYRKNDSPELGPGIRFFDWARRMTVDAFYTSPMGIKELDYRGNTPMAKYEVPVEAIQYALKKSGYA
jgi:gluconate 2-dehydrogenase gamma chain